MYRIARRAQALHLSVFICIPQFSTLSYCARSDFREITTRSNCAVSATLAFISALNAHQLGRESRQVGNAHSAWNQSAASARSTWEILMLNSNNTRYAFSDLEFRNCLRSQVVTSRELCSLFQRPVRPNSVGPMSDSVPIPIIEILPL